MKRFGLLTTIFLFTVSLAVYSRNSPVTLASLRNHTVAKNNPFSRMTKEPD
jgi:hypothetical protein